MLLIIEVEHSSKLAYPVDPADIRGSGQDPDLQSLVGVLLNIVLIEHKEQVKEAVLRNLEGIFGVGGKVCVQVLRWVAAQFSFHSEQVRMFLLLDFEMKMFLTGSNNLTAETWDPNPSLSCHPVEKMDSSSVIFPFLSTPPPRSLGEGCSARSSW